MQMEAQHNEQPPASPVNDVPQPGTPEYDAAAEAFLASVDPFAMEVLLRMKKTRDEHPDMAARYRRQLDYQIEVLIAEVCGCEPPPKPKRRRRPRRP
jgi:hypothetical protein